MPVIKKIWTGSYKGKVVYLDIWGTCRARAGVKCIMHPGLRKGTRKGYIVSVYFDMDDDKKEAVLKENGLPVWTGRWTLQAEIITKYKTAGKK